MNPDARPLIDDFWAGTATLVERQRLLALLGPDEAEAAAWLLLPDDDADAAGLPGPPPAPLNPEQAARVLRRLHWRLALDAAIPVAAVAAPRPRLRTRARRARWAALALAVLVLALGLSWRLMQRPAPAPPLVRQAAPPGPLLPAANRAAGLAASPALIRRTNAGPAPLRLPLPDGSVVTLEAHSTLTYAPFELAGRELSLRGAALFAVKKDAARPFTVEAGGFTTTALGTRFRVVSRAGGRVSVRLLRGRVVVRPVEGSAFAMQPQYLTPGRELSANTRTQEVRVGAFDSVAVPPRAARAARAARAVRAIPAAAAAPPAAQPDNQGHPAALTVWVCTWCRHTYTSPKQPTSFEPDKCPRNPGKAHAWHKKYPGLDAN